MREQTGKRQGVANAPSNEFFPQDEPTTWFGRAAGHRGIVLLLAIAFIIITIPKPASVRDVDRDMTGEDVPLFI
jgi:hypothetical protein